MKKIILSLLLCFATWHISASGYMLAKAHLSQYLIKHAWQQSLMDKQRHKPWSWADTYPVFEISIARLNKHSYILQGASGRNMAFSAAKIISSGMPGTAKSTLISGHRDSHFEYLQDVVVGDIIDVKTTDKSFKYQVISLQVIDSQNNLLQVNKKDELILSTCYPFNSLRTGGSLRYVVTTKPV